MKKFLIFIFIIAFFCIKTEASQMRLLVGPKLESVAKITQTRDRSNPSSVVLEFDTKAYKNIFLSLGVSGEFNVSTFSSNGFTMYFNARYYLKGNPDLIKSQGKDIKIRVSEPFSYFVGLGYFQKTISFTGNRNLKDIVEDIGGLTFSAGGNYSLSNRYFIAGHISYLISGLGSDLDYSSIEAYGGIGVRF